MDAVKITFFINSLCIAIANQLSDEELALAAAVFTQVGDTLATIIVTKELEKNSI